MIEKNTRFCFMQKRVLIKGIIIVCILVIGYYYYKIIVADNCM